MESVDLRLLLVSAAISFVAAYAAIEIAGRLRAAPKSALLPWLITGSIAVGTSFWGMQYIGMLAYGVPEQSHPFLAFFTLSRTLAIGAAALALWTAAFNPLSIRTRWPATLVIGAGIVGVHLVGIIGVVLPSKQSFLSLPWIIASFLASILAVTLAFEAIFRLRSATGIRATRLRLLGSIGLGGGIIVIHVCGMNALRSYSGLQRLPVNPAEYLIASVAIVSFAFALAAIGASMFDRRIRHERERLSTLEERYSRERRLALTFQRALLPASLPRVDGITFSTSYVPSTLDDGIGGDWFDAFVLDDGRVALSIGDAAGHGTSAAIAMNIVRQSFRNAAEECSDPSDVMRRANRVLLHSGSPSLVTAIFAFLDPGSLEMQYACAGHPPPLVADARGFVSTLPGIGSGLPIGIFSDYSIETQHTHLPSDALVAFYTDGFIEHSRDIVAGIAGLSAALGEQKRRNVTEPAREIDANIFGEQPRTDDAAILIVATHDVPASIELTYPPALASAPRARAALRRYLAKLAISDDRSFDILVAVGEAVANAIEHAYCGENGGGSIRMSIAPAGIGRLAVSVHDRGVWRESDGASDRGRGIHLMRTLADDFAIQDSASGTVVKMEFSLAARGAAAELVDATTGRTTVNVLP